MQQAAIRSTSCHLPMPQQHTVDLGFAGQDGWTVRCRRLRMNSMNEAIVLVCTKAWGETRTETVETSLGRLPCCGTLRTTVMVTVMRVGARPLFVSRQCDVGVHQTLSSSVHDIHHA
ncbi:hypothetical protein J3458_003317 [Metarhizium acridum]|uniref:uncharacterized protein n=1 Tax=Metarhizium acridum TaxID=92637 RepID=UPI001C6C128D|nr:hypothetical protein J3458_003317 [Metarhizium acridum]